MSKAKVSIFGAFKTDTDGERNGIPVTFHGADGFEATFTVARAGGRNDRFHTEMEKRSRPYRKSGTDMAQISPEVQRKIMAEVYADCVVVGWSGVYNDDGSEIAYSRENAVMLFTALPDLLDFIIGEATRVSNYRAAQLKDEAGN